MRQATPRVAAGIGIALAVVAGGVAPAGGQSAGTAQEWMPLELGAEHVYRAHWDYSFQWAGGSAVRRFSLGWIRDRVVERGPVSTAAGAPILRVRQETEEKEMEGGSLRRQVQDHFLASGSAGTVRHQPQERPRSEGQWPALRKDTIRFLPASPAVGQEWDAGVLHDGRMRIRLRGAVLAREDIQLSGRSYPDCLHVRLVGDPEGSTQAGDRQARIESGRFENDLWLARGVGVVRAVVRTDLVLRTSDDVEVRSSGVTTSYLSTGASP